MEFEKIYNKTPDPLASEIIKAIDEFIATEADAAVNGVYSRKILYLNALTLAGLTREKVKFTKKTYDILEGHNLQTANAYYISPNDKFYLSIPRDEILSNNELYKNLNRE
jgi:hypothetical protein